MLAEACGANDCGYVQPSSVAYRECSDITIRHERGLMDLQTDSLELIRFFSSSSPCPRIQVLLEIWLTCRQSGCSTRRFHEQHSTARLIAAAGRADVASEYAKTLDRNTADLEILDLISLKPSSQDPRI
jgi:hypothetical protein